MKDLKFQLQEYCCIKQESAALPSKQYEDGQSELTFTGSLDNEFDEFVITFATNSTVYHAKCNSADRKTWTIEPALQEQINTTTVINKYLPIKAIEPGDIPSLSQTVSIVNNKVLESTTTNAMVKTFAYKTTYRKNIQFTIPESRYLIGFKMYAKEKSDSEEYVEVSPQIRYDKLDTAQTISINIAIQLYELLFFFTTISQTITVQPKA